MLRHRFETCSFLHRLCYQQLRKTSAEKGTRKRFVQTDNHNYFGEIPFDNDSDASRIPPMGRGVRVGQYAMKKRTYTLQNIQEFGNLVEDFNPLHSPQDFVARDSNGDAGDCMSNSVIGKPLVDAGLIRMDDDGYTIKPLVHGMLVSSIFSSIFSSLAPGCVYLNQTLDFVAPVHAGDTVVAHVKVDGIRKWRKGGVVVQCRTQVFKSIQVEDLENEEGRLVAIKGNANVWLPQGYEALSR